MHKLLKLLALFCFLLFQGCEDDEICIDTLSAKLNTSITAQDTTSVFSISNIIVTEITENTEVFTGANVSSFKVLLSALDTSATYKIDLTFSSSDPLQSKAPISETLTINYTPSNEYVSKACGFKTIYKDLNYSTTGILTVNSPKTVINNENETHLNLQY